ncbi:TerD domain-containing protein, partial [Streptomyces sp. MBT56]|uniref:TerD family protein n=1 Tax=Streptomyces sp. MBT56 TaxID=1488387 RepID=UPI00190D9F08
DFVFYNQPAHTSGAVRHEGKRTAPDGVTDTLLVDFGKVEPGIERIVVAASADGGNFGRVSGLYVRVTDAAGGSELARFESTDATVETAFILGELYLRQGAWKFRAVGQGYSTGLEGLATDFGISVDEPQQAPPATQPVRLTKITLTKSAPSVSLAKQGGTSGALRVNLNWEVRKQFKGWGAKLGRAVAMHADLDLDLCALYELTDGRKGVVQSLGNAFGSLNQPPFIHLDGDDRTGALSTGENMTINLDHKNQLRRVLIFVTIYEGARSFADLHATVTLQPQNGAAVDFSLDECTVPSTVCALALITNTGGDLTVQREARYLVPDRGVSPQRTIDAAYGWGMNWTPGRK